MNFWKARRQNRSQTHSQVENQHFVRDFWLPPNTDFHTLKKHFVPHFLPKTDLCHSQLNPFTMHLRLDCFKLMWQCAFIAFRIHLHVVNSFHPELVSSRVQFNQSSVHSQFDSLTTQYNHRHVHAGRRGQFIHNPVLTQLNSFYSFHWELNKSTALKFGCLHLNGFQASYASFERACLNPKPMVLGCNHSCGGCGDGRAQRSIWRARISSKSRYTFPSTCDKAGTPSPYLQHIQYAKLCKCKISLLKHHFKYNHHYYLLITLIYFNSHKHHYLKI